MTHRDGLNILNISSSVMLGYGCASMPVAAVLLVVALQVACYVFVRTCITFPGEKP